MPDEVTTTTAAPASVAPAAPVKAAPPAPPPGDVRTAEADAKPVVGVPEKYELQAPEGMTFHPADLAKFEALAREQGYDNDMAQAMVEVLAQADQDTKARQEEALARAEESWINELKADKDLGGVNFDRTIGRVNLVFSKLPPQIASEAQAAFASLGLGNHPAMVRMIEGIGSWFEPDGPIETGSSLASEGNYFFPKAKRST